MHDTFFNILLKYTCQPSEILFICFLVAAMPLFIPHYSETLWITLVTKMPTVPLDNGKTVDLKTCVPVSSFSIL